MSSNIKLSYAAAAACAGDGTNKGLLPLLAGGKVQFYDGTQPASPDAAYNSAPADQHIICATTQVALGTPAATESNGVLTLAALATSGIVSYAATATWFRIFESDGTTALIDGTVGQTGCDINFGTAPYNVFAVTGLINALTGTITIPSH